MADSLKAKLEPYREEFNQITTRFIQKRIRILCLLIFALFWFSTAITIALTLVEEVDARRELFSWWEIPVDLMIITTTIIGFFFVKGAGRLLSVKLTAYFINAVMLISFAIYYLIYPETFNTGALSMLLIVFVIMMTMPWTVAEVITVFLGTSLLFMAVVWLSDTPYLQGPSYLANNLFVFLFSGIAAVVFKSTDEKRRIEQFLLRKEVEEKNKIMESELELARRVNHSLIPKSFANDKVEVAVTYLPMFYVGGDYAKFEFLDENRFLIFIMDVTGHGVSAALLVNRIHAEVSNMAREHSHPGAMLKELDAFVQKAFEGTHKFLTACACLLDFNSNKLFYSNFGHPPQVLYQNRTQDISWLKSQRFMLGIAGVDTNKIYETELEFGKGDKIFLFTDGILEVKGKEGEFYGEKRLEAHIKDRSKLSPEEFNQSLLSELDSFKKETFSDDIFLLNIQIKA